MHITIDTDYCEGYRFFAGYSIMSSAELGEILLNVFMCGICDINWGKNVYRG